MKQGKEEAETKSRSPNRTGATGNDRVGNEAGWNRRERTHGRISGWKGKTGRKLKHLWNGCGSEAGKSEREQTGELNKQNRET